MTWWQRFRHRWRLERDLDAELGYHLDRLTNDLTAAGIPPADARRRAAEEFGSVEAVKDACRDVRGTRLAHDLAFDLRTGARLLVRERGVTFLAVFALAVGLGVSTTLFTIVDALCLRRFPLEQVDRLVEIGELLPSGARQGLTRVQWNRLAAGRIGPLEDLAAYASRPAVVRDADTAAERITVAYTSGTMFGTLRLRPSVGRGLAEADDSRATAPAIVLGGRLRRVLAPGTAAGLGHVLRVDGAETTVVGVMPDGFAFPDRADAWRPLSALTAPAEAPVLTVVGRLAPDATADQVRDAVTAVLAASTAADADARIAVTALDERYRNPVTNPAWLAFITTALLLALIAGSNVATLLLARGARRQREIAIRLALGATRGRVVRQLLVETSLLALAGGIGAVAVGTLGLRLFELAIPDGGIPYWVSLTMSPRVFAALALTCLGLIALSGLAPALTLARAGARAPLQGQDGRGATTGRSTRRWTWVFLTSQLGLTVLLLCAVGLTTMSILTASRGRGIDGERILTFAVSLPQARYADAAVRRGYYERLAAGLGQSGRVRSIALASALPIGPGEMRRIVTGAAPAASDPPVRVMSVGRGFFSTIGLELVAGREASEVAAGTTEAVVNARLATLLLGSEPIGRTLRLVAPNATAPDRVTVVGVVADPPGPVAAPAAVFLALAGDQLASVSVLVATREAAAGVAPIAREVARTLDPDVPLTRLMSLGRAQWNARWNARVSQGLITTIALVALLLATVGLTALTSQWVSQSARELGVRVALGARPGQIVWLVLRRVLLQLAVGLTAGAAGAWGWSRIFGPPGALTAPANLAAVAAVVLVVTLGAAYWPARRASRVDPLAALRAE